MNYQPAPSEHLKEEVNSDFLKALSVLNKWKLFILLGTLLCGVIAGVWAFTRVPVYQANAVMMVREAIAQLPYDSQVSDLTGKPLMTMDTYLAQLNSDVVRDMMIQDLDLDKRSYRPGSISTQVVANTNLINVSVQDPNPRLAAEIANSLCQQFLFLLSDEDLESMQLRVAADRQLQKASDALRQFRESTRPASVIAQEITNKTDEIALLETKIKNAASDEQGLQSKNKKLTSDLKSIPRMITDPTTDPVTGKVSSVDKVNPEYTAVSQQLTQAKTTLKKNRDQNLQLKKQLQKKQQVLNALKNELSDVQLTETRLQDDAARLQSARNSLLAQAAQEQASQPNKNVEPMVKIISKASEPQTPAGPDKMMSIAIGLAAGLMLFTILAFLADIFDNSPKTT